MLLGECLHGSSSWVPTPTASRSGLFGCDRSRTQNSLNFPNISNHVCQVKSSQAGHAAGMSRIGAVARTKGPLFSGCRQPARLNILVCAPTAEVRGKRKERSAAGSMRNWPYLSPYW